MVDPGEDPDEEQQQDMVATLLLESESEGKRSFDIDENPIAIDDSIPYRPSIDFPNAPAHTLQRDGLYMQFMSDVHLEFRRVEGAPVFQPRAPILALIGDIGNPSMKNWRQFLWRNADRYEHVFLVAGNHEFYLSTPEIAKEKMRRICSKKPNLHFLDNDFFDITPDIRIVGTTLWSNPLEKHHKYLQDNMSDYSQIGKTDTTYIIPADVAEWHSHARKFIEDQRQWAKTNGKQLVILTHHAPIPQALPKEQRKTWIASGYTTDLRELFGPPIILWAYGHTHIAYDKVVRGTRIVSNPLGYKTQRLLEKGLFQAEKIVALEPPPHQVGSKPLLECLLL